MAFVGLKENEKQYLRHSLSENGRAYTVSTPGRAERIAEASRRVRSTPALAPYMADYRFKPIPKRKLVP